YAVTDLTGQPAALDDSIKEAPLFYGTFGFVTLLAMSLVLIPGAPMVPILVLTQVLNAILLLPLLAFMYGIARDRKLMGEHIASKGMAATYIVAIVLIAACIVSLGVLSFS
ncbi:MAG: hypothetical protein KGL72_06010, partial [Actinomycetales bacterium]|nr:hypothetical protein [Actinomycetales bacterium]